MTRAAWRVITAAVVVALVSAGCGGDRVNGVSRGKIQVLHDTELPPDLLGLTVGPEDVTKAVATLDRSYVDGIAVYGFRSGKVLQATLQVSRLIDESRYTTREFREGLVNGIGASTPQPVRVDDDVVYRTTGTDQQVIVWFRGRIYYVLAVRNDFPLPKTLVRRVLELTT